MPRSPCQIECARLIWMSGLSGPDVNRRILPVGTVPDFIEGLLPAASRLDRVTGPSGSRVRLRGDVTITSGPQRCLLRSTRQRLAVSSITTRIARRVLELLGSSGGSGVSRNWTFCARRIVHRHAFW
jgi:hypothetical protein